MEFLAAALLGLLVAVVGYLVLSRSQGRSRDEIAELAAGARGEERLRTLEQGIEASLREVRQSLGHVSELVQRVDGARGESLARLATVVHEGQRQVEALTSSTSRIAEMLAGSQSRGQWGERIADDILRAAGFIEGVNFERNRQAGAGRPDFTFLLPEGRVLHMDVKFPLTNYARHMQAETDIEREQAARQFLADVRATVRSLASREYIDPERGTLDFVLMFIPNERVYAFLYERDPSLVDDAQAQRVVLCSPLTLFAVLAVIRQSVDSFALHARADEILRALGGFNRQWTRYREAVARVGRAVDSAQRAYEELAGVRTRQLERQIERVEQLRLEARIELPVVDPGEEDDEAGAPDGVREAPAGYAE
jgi:DNA recombination protein RmuC